MSWTVVEFRDSMTVEAIPTSWIINNNCYWPPMPRDKIMSEIRKKSPPNTCWPLHAVRIFKDGTYDDYLVARQKAKKAEDTSDLNSDNPNEKRKITRKKISSSSSDDEDLISILSKPPAMTLQKKRDLETTSSEHLDQNRNPLNKEYIASSQLDPQTNNQSSSNDCICCKIHQKKSESSMVELMRKMTLMRAHLLQISEDMQNLMTITRQPALEDFTEDKFLKSFQFPVNTVENLEVDVNQYLEDDTKFKRAVHELSKLGGSNTYDFVKRCLTLTLTNSLATEYSYYGAKKKRVFKDLKINEALLCASEKRDSTVDQKATEEAIKKWLRRAKERDNNNINKVVK